MIYTLNKTNGIHLLDLHGRLFGVQIPRINYYVEGIAPLGDRVVESIQ
jgi:hypothetical protein